MPAKVHPVTGSIRFDRSEVTGSIGDAVTVLPIIVAVTVLTDLSLALILIWFGIFQIVWGVYYGVPISIEPMKVFAALVIAGDLVGSELVIAGILIGVILLGIGITGSLERVGDYIDDPVIRGVQLGVGLILLETGIGLGLEDLTLSFLAVGLASAIILAGYWNLSAITVLAVGGAIALYTTGLPQPGLPGPEDIVVVSTADVTAGVFEATAAQIAMTVGNAALAASVLLGDYFDRKITPDQLSNSMGLMNVVSVPLGAFPMCHGSGGIAGKYAFGARTAGANILLGVGYVLLAVLAVGVVAAFPLSMLGVILCVIAFQLGKTSLDRTEAYPLVILVGVLGLLINLGVAFVVGIVISLLIRDGGPLPDFRRR